MTGDFVGYWNEVWNSDGPETLECFDCGETLLGDGMARAVQCVSCWVLMQVVEDEGTVCHECIEPGEAGLAKTCFDCAESEPDGFTCVRCGEEYTPSSGGESYDPPEDGGE